MIECMIWVKSKVNVSNPANMKKTTALFKVQVQLKTKEHFKSVFEVGQY